MLKLRAMDLKRNVKTESVVEIQNVEGRAQQKYEEFLDQESISFLK